MEEIFQERRENHALVVVRLTITTHSSKEIDDLLTSIVENDFVIKVVRFNTITRHSNKQNRINTQKIKGNI